MSMYSAASTTSKFTKCKHNKKFKIKSLKQAKNPQAWDNLQYHSSKKETYFTSWFIL